MKSENKYDILIILSAGEDAGRQAASLNNQSKSIAVAPRIIEIILMIATMAPYSNILQETV